MDYRVLANIRSSLRTIRKAKHELYEALKAHDALMDTVLHVEESASDGSSPCYICTVREKGAHKVWCPYYTREKELREKIQGEQI